MGGEDKRATRRRRRKRRPHVVMLVDNTINGDSRVQKQARSMSDLGWRVTLVGIAPKTGPIRVKIKGVQTIHLPLMLAAGTPAHLDRRSVVRSPLAYPSRREAIMRQGLAEAAVVSAGEAIDLDKLTDQDRGARRLASRARMAVARTRRGVVRHRHDRTERLRDRRASASGRVDRLVTRWWLATRGDRAWEKLDPQLWDWELAYGPTIDALEPDIIHANDQRMLAIGARAAMRARVAGRRTKLVWDAHEWVAGREHGSSVNERRRTAQVLLEREYAARADAVVTVSDRLAQMLYDEFELPERPSVVCNAPLMRGLVAPRQDVREVAGLPGDVPLLVYSGGISPARSVDTIVRALPELPGVHFVVVVLNPKHAKVQELCDLAVELGVGDRMHVAPYVPVNQIVPYLAGADVGVHSLLHGPNNEIALATKFYEYAQAKLPIVVTDVKVMAETTRRLGIGEVYSAGDPSDLARAVRAVLADTGRYRKAFDDDGLMRSWTWEAQAEVLDGVYRRVLDAKPPRIGET